MRDPRLSFEMEVPINGQAAVSGGGGGLKVEPTSVTLELRVEVELGVEVSGSHRLWMLLSAKDSRVATS